MKKTVLIALCGFASTAFAISVYEGFDYTAGQALNNSGGGGNVVGNGGTGWGTNWFGNSGLTFNAVGSNTVSKTWSTPTNYNFTPTGSAMQQTTNSNVAYRGLTETVDFGADGTVYFSFLFNDANTSGNFNFGFTDSTGGSNTASGPYLGIQFSSGSGQGMQAVSGANGGSKTSNFFGNNQYSANTDYLIVGKILTFADGSSFDTIAFNLYAAGDTVALTDPGAAGNFTYSYGAAGMSGSADRITFSSSNLGNDFSGNQSSSMITDELRIGDTWGSVAIPEPSTLVLVGLALGSLALFRRRKA